MLNMVFAIQGCDIRATERATTIVAKESQPAEVVLFTKRKLAAAILGVDWEELGRDYFTTILAFKAFQVKCAFKCSHELTGQRLITFLAKS
jgi:hypothetical protein